MNKLAGMIVGLALVVPAIMGVGSPVVAQSPSVMRVTELSVLHVWRGHGCRYQPPGPFFLIKDLDTLRKFWKSVQSDEGMPHVDFEKYMLLGWTPGATMFDFVPVSVRRFFIENDHYIVLFEYRKRQTGGYWRQPWLLTMLPRVQRGDLHIMRLGDPLRGEADRVPITTIWDMDRERYDKVNFDAFAVEKKRQDTLRAAALAARPVRPSGGGGGSGGSRVSTGEPATVHTAAVVPTTPTTPSQPSAGNVPSSAVRPGAGTTISRPGSNQSPVRPPGDATPSAPPRVAPPAASPEEDDPFGFGTGKSAAQAPAQPPSQPKTQPAQSASAKGKSGIPTEDELFGEEFNLEF
jgi:hypothetical protein